MLTELFPAHAVGGILVVVGHFALAVAFPRTCGGDPWEKLTFLAL